MREPLSVSGSFDFIDEGEVTPIGNTGYYRVNDRHVWGTLGGEDSEGSESDIEGSFFMTYDAIVAIETQEGPFWGELELYDEVDDITYTARFHSQSEGELTSFEPGVGGTMELEIEGRLRFIDNACGRADFDGSIEVALDAAGHIAGILGSEFSVEGYWNPDGEDHLVHHIEDVTPDALLV